MTAERQFEAQIRSWLEAEASPIAVPDGLASAVLARTAHENPRPAWLARTSRSHLDKLQVSTFSLPGVAAAMLAAAVVVGLILGALQRQQIGPTPGSQTPTVQPSVSAAASAGSWTLTGPDEGAAKAINGVLLNDGRVLYGNRLYDPNTGTWQPTDLPTTFTGAISETLLADGRVLVIGGRAAVFDPEADSWSPTGPMIHPRNLGTATLLPDGRVLLAGGMGPHGSYDYLATAELFDPATLDWTATGSMLTPRGAHGIGNEPGQSATLLPDGDVLVAGGRVTPFKNTTSVEIYHVATGTWSATGSMSAPRQFHAAVLLDNGLVLVVGGNRVGDVNGELYDPATGAWQSLPESPRVYLGSPTATELLDGRVLFVGGAGSAGTPMSYAEIYDPASGHWTSAGSLQTERQWHASVRLDDGRVLVVGGETHVGPGVFGPVSSVEVYVPGAP